MHLQEPKKSAYYGWYEQQSDSTYLNITKEDNKFQ